MTTSQQQGSYWGHGPSFSSSTKRQKQTTIGKVIGSQAWEASGEQAKARGVSDMKAAGEARDAGTQGYGKAEEVAGRAVGCEGMLKEGEGSKTE